MKSIFTLAKTFDYHYGIWFSDVRSTDIAKHLQASNFLYGARLKTRFCFVRIAKFFIRCPTALFFIETEAADNFGITHLQASLLLSCDRADAVLTLQASQRYVHNTDRPNTNPGLIRSISPQSVM